MGWVDPTFLEGVILLQNILWIAVLMQKYESDFFEESLLTWPKFVSVDFRNIIVKKMIQQTFDFYSVKLLKHIVVRTFSSSS